MKSLSFVAGLILALLALVTCQAADGGDDSDGRLVISATHAGVFWLDMVSLFPPTHNNQPNGLRPDLVKLLADLNEEPDYDVYASAVTDEAAGEVVVRVVNIAESPKHVTLLIDGGELTGAGTAITLAAESRKASQSLDAPLRYSPKTTQLKGVSRESTHEVPPCSFTNLRLKQRGG